MASPSDTAQKPVTMTEIKQLPADATAEAIHHVLKRLNQDDGLDIYPYVVSFADQARANNWAAYLPDMPFRKTLKGWLRSAAGGKRCRVALFSEPSENWVGLKPADWDQIPWHCWVGVIIPRAKGKRGHLVIWDCDKAFTVESGGVRKTSLHNGFLAGLQRQLVKERGAMTGAVWGYSSWDDAGKLLCLRRSLEKVKELAELEDGILVEDWPGAEELDEEERLDRLPEYDSRLKGCERVGVDFEAPPTEHKDKEVKRREPSARLRDRAARRG